VLFSLILPTPTTSLFRFSRLTSPSDSACYVTCTPKRPTFVVARYVPSVVSLGAFRIPLARIGIYLPAQDAVLPPRPFELRFALSLSLRRERPFVSRGDMEIKSIALFRGLHREIGSYFICAIKTRMLTRGRKSRRKTRTVPPSQTRQAEGCTRPDLLIVDMPIVCSSASLSHPSPSLPFPAIFFRFLPYSPICHLNASPDCARCVTYAMISRR